MATTNQQADLVENSMLNFGKGLMAQNANGWRAYRNA
jgi:hypothetical protein